MGTIVRCSECAAVYRDLEELGDLRDNDSICLRCNGPIEIADWDWLLSTWEEDPDLDDVEEGQDEDDDWGVDEDVNLPEEEEEDLDEDFPDDDEEEEEDDEDFDEDDDR